MDSLSASWQPTVGSRAQLECWIAEQEMRYADATPRSGWLHDRASAVMPGGDTRLGTWAHPHPLYLRRGRGSSVWDADGRELLDLLSPLTCIHGHSHPDIVGAIGRQSERGTSWLAANVKQVRFAELLCGRVPSFERVRFTSSGSEATMLMVRIARAFTGNDLILKFCPSAHGSYEGFDAELDEDGFLREAHGGVPKNAFANVVVGTFNDVAQAARLVSDHAGSLAGVIVSPLSASETGSGYVPATTGFLEALRAVTAESGALLLFDEVVTFRQARGGAQAQYGVTPDVTALGKMIGGGLPIGAVGGREDVLSVTSPGARGLFPRASGERRAKWLGVSGSFNGNPATMAAGIATLELLTPGAYERLNESGSQLRGGLQEVAARTRLPISVTGAGSILSITLDAGLAEGDADLANRLMNAIGLAFRSRGVLAFQHFTPSTVTSMSEVNRCLSTASEVFSSLAAAIEA